MTSSRREGPGAAGPSLLRLPGADRVSLHVELHGDGPPLLLIQGLGYATWAWTRQLPALAPRWQAIAFDNRGAGRSAKPPGPYSIELLADDAAAVLDGLEVGSTHVLGLSMGGYIALTLALRRPDLVDSLVLAATGPGGPGSLPVPEATRAAWLDAAGLPPDEFARRTMPLSFAPGWTDAHPDEYEELLAARLEHPTPAECWAAQYEACARYLERGVPVERVDVPALVLHGDADGVVPLENGRTLARRLPRAELLVLPGRGHLALIEAADAFNAAVAEFLLTAPRRRNQTRA